MGTAYTVYGWVTNIYGQSEDSSGVPTTTESQLPDELQLYYSFEESTISGLQVKNIKTGLYDGTLQGAGLISSTVFQFGSSALSGYGSVVVDPVTIPAESVGFSVSFWINKSHNFGGYTFRITDGTNPIVAMQYGSNTLYIQTTSATGSVRTYNTTSNVSDAWTHYALTFAAGNLSNLYLNGALFRSFATVFYPAPGIYTAYIGPGDYSTSSAYTLSYDDVVLFNKTLSAAEVSLMYAGNSTLEYGDITSFVLETVTATSVAFTYAGTYTNVIIKYGTTSGSTTFSSTLSGTSGSITELSPNTNYYFNIYPVNSSGGQGTSYGTERSTTTSILITGSLTQISDFIDPYNGISYKYWIVASGSSNIDITAANTANSLHVLRRWGGEDHAQSAGWKGLCPPIQQPTCSRGSYSSKWNWWFINYNRRTINNGNRWFTWYK
jgi:hypothetical protein